MLFLLLDLLADIWCLVVGAGAFAVQSLGLGDRPRVEAIGGQEWGQNEGRLLADTANAVRYAGLGELGERLLLERRQRKGYLIPDIGEITESFTHFSFFFARNLKTCKTFILKINRKKAS
jgi:hypothetical protein